MTNSPSRSSGRAVCLQKGVRPRSRSVTGRKPPNQYPVGSGLKLFFGSFFSREKGTLLFASFSLKEKEVNYSLLMAALSPTRTTLGCIWRMEAGTWGVTGPVKAAFTMSALSSPLTTTRIWRASMMDLMPMVMA